MKYYIPTLLLLSLLSTKLYAQDNYMAVFNNALNCSTATATSISGQSGVSNPIYANSAFDRSGNLLFTTNDTAIYSASGTKIYSFSSGGCFSKATNSEEIIFPIPSACKNYYILFESDADTCGSGNALVAVWVNASGSTPTVVSQTNIYTTANSGGAVAASQLHTDGSRDIYYLTDSDWVNLTVNDSGTFSLGPVYNIGTSISSTPFSVVTPNETDFAFSVSDYEIYDFNFSVESYGLYILPLPHSNRDTLKGLEYCTADSDWYVSYKTTSGGGGLAYTSEFDEDFTEISGTNTYNKTTLAWTNGHLFFTGADGDIAYMNVTLGNPTPSITTTSISNSNYMDGSGSYFGLNKQIEGGSNYSIPPTVTASASPTSICYNTSSTLTASGASAYTWYPTSGLNADSGSSVIATLTTTTTYTVTGTDSNGCANTANVSVNVNPQLFTYSGGSTSVCVGGTDTLGGNPAAAGGVPPLTYSWFNEGADSVFSTSTNPVVTVTYPNLYTLTVTDSVGCTATGGAIITLFTVSAGISDTILSGASDTLGGKPVNNGGHSPFTYNWTSKPTGFTSPVANPIVSPTVTFTYYLSVTDSTGCTVNDSVTISVITIDTIITLNTPDTSVQTYTSTGFTDTVQWYKFTADSGTVIFTIPNDSVSTNVTQLSVFCTACPGFSVMNLATKAAGSATSLSVIEEGLNPGQLYYIAVSQPRGNNTTYTLEYDNEYDTEDTAYNYTSNTPIGSTYLPFDKTGWAVIFDDEFSQDTAFRRDYWNKGDYRAYWKGQGQSQSDSNNVELINGHLRLLQEKISNPADYIATPITINDSTTITITDSITNGEITTRNNGALFSSEQYTITFLPNIYVESEVWLNFPKTFMTDPSVFLWNGGACTSQGINPYSEIDNFEFGGSKQQFYYATMTLHWPAACRCTTTNGNVEGSADTIPNIHEHIPDIRDTFHTWGMQYSPNKVAWYLDNKNIKTDTNRAHIYLQPMILDIGDGLPYGYGGLVFDNGIKYAVADTITHNWMDLSYVKVYTDSLPILNTPSVMCASDTPEFQLYAYPGVTYDWRNDSTVIAFQFKGTAPGNKYGSPFIGHASNDGSVVRVRFRTGFAVAGMSYPIKITLNGLDGTSFFQVIRVYVDSISVSPATSDVCSCQSSILTASGASAYTWSPSAGLSTTTGSSVIANPTVTTTYTVSSPGCITTATSVVIAPCFTDEDDTEYDVCDNCLASCNSTDVLKMKIDTITSLNSSAHLKIYPNPNNGAFTLQLFTDSNATIAQIKLFNILGQIVFDENSTVVSGYLQQQIQPRGVVDGVYLVRVDDGKSVYKQMVVINK